MDGAGNQRRRPADQAGNAAELHRLFDHPVLGQGARDALILPIVRETILPLVDPKYRGINIEASRNGGTMVAYLL